MDPEIQIQTALKNYFFLNNTPDVSPMITWEAHKSVIRGELMNWGGQGRKKERERNIENLLTKISKLETLHKQSLTKETEQKWIINRKEWPNLLDATMKTSLFLKKSIYYEFGDKGGKYLAKAFKRDKNSRKQSLYTWQRRKSFLRCKQNCRTVSPVLH